MLKIADIVAEQGWFVLRGGGRVVLYYPISLMYERLLRLMVRLEK
jgi:hypothetical protein